MPDGTPRVLQHFGNFLGHARSRAAGTEGRAMSEFHKRVIEAINAVVRRSATYPNALYLGAHEHRQLQDDVRAADGAQAACEDCFGLKVFRVDEPSHFAAVWNPSIAPKEEPSAWRLDYIEVHPLRTTTT